MWHTRGGAGRGHPGAVLMRTGVGRQQAALASSPMPGVGMLSLPRQLCLFKRLAVRSPMSAGAPRKAGK